MHARSIKAMPMGGMAGIAGLKQLAMRLYAGLLRAYRSHLAERELMQASDDMLKDIGITRSEIAGVVWLGVEDDTRRRR